MSQKDEEKKKKKKQQSILEKEIFGIMEKSMKTALDAAVDDLLKDWDKEIKGTVSQQLLENQCIPTAIYKEFSGKCMSEEVYACSANTTLVIIFLDCAGESVLRHHFSINRTEQIVFGCATTNAHVFRQNLCHLAAQRNRLQFSCFGMTVDHTLVRQRNIPVLNVADCSRAATRID